MCAGADSGWERKWHPASWRVALGGTLLIFAVQARAELVEIDWDRSATFERTLTIPAHRFLEVCGKLVRGQSVAWRFESTAPSDFNIHYHQGKQVVYPAREVGVDSSEGRLDITTDQDYCWMWSSKGDLPIELRLKLERR